jgi:hypothetical protein
MVAFRATQSSQEYAKKARRPVNDTPEKKDSPPEGAAKAEAPHDPSPVTDTETVAEPATETVAEPATEPAETGAPEEPDAAGPQPPEPEATSGRPKTRRRGRRRLTALAFTLALAAGLCGLAWSMIGKPIDAPQWVRHKIEERIAQSVPAIQVDFGRMSLVVSGDGLARIILWDVQILNAQGGMVAQLSDIEAAIAPVSLLKRQWELREAQVSGAFLTLQRDREGKLGLALGDAFAAGTEVPDLAQIIAQVDAIAQDPRLAKLDVIEADALTVRYEDLRAQRGWTADGGRVSLRRSGGALKLAGDVALLSGGDGVATLDVAAESEIGQRDFTFSIEIDNLPSEDIASQTAALAWLDALDAPISGSLASSFDETGALGLMRATLDIGKGVLAPTRQTRPLRFREARTAFTFDPVSAILRFDVLRVASPLVTVDATGTAQLDLRADGWLDGLTGQFAFTDIAVAEGGVLQRDIALAGAETAFKLQLDPFEVTVGALRVNDPGFPIRAEGRLTAAPSGWDLAVDVNLKETTTEQVLDFWPKAQAPGARRFVANRVEAGVLKDVRFAMRAPAGEGPRNFIDFRFEDAAVRYASQQEPITHGRGRASIYAKRFALRLDEGQVATAKGPLQVGGSEFVIPDLDTDPLSGVISLNARGTLGAALAHVDNDSWRILRRAGRDADMATGEAEVTGTIAIPFKDDLRLADVDISLDGIARNVVGTGIIKDRTITSDRLEVTLRNGPQRAFVEVSGPAAFDGIPLDGRWRQPLDGGDSSLRGEVEITPRGLDALGVSLPSGMLRGRGTGELSVDLRSSGPPRFELTSNLAGLGLSIPELGWTLGERQTGAFALRGTLGTPVAVEALSLSGAGLDAEGRLQLRNNGSFERLELSRLKLGDWLDVSGRLRSNGGGAPIVEIASGRVDLREATFNTGGGGDGTGNGNGSRGNSAPLRLNLDSLRVTENIELRDVRGEFETGRGLEGAFAGSLGGETPVQGRVERRRGGSAFLITGEDAGDILREAGLLQTVKDGTFKLDLLPVRGQPGSFDGSLNILGARMQKAPTIASLLDAISVVGLVDQMNGPGIFFSEVQAQFRLTPRRVIVTRSSAVGPSMGVSLDGYYDLERGEMDMQGVLSPIYVVNAIGRLIAREGEGLIGFNFNLKGPVAKPRVSVNPLSVFTPGMFRDIFRRPPPKLSQ